MILGRKEIDKDTDKGDRGGLLQAEQQQEEKKFLRFTWLSSLIAGLFVDTQLSTRKPRVNARKKTSHFPWTNNQGTAFGTTDLQAMPHVTHGHDDGHCPEIGGQRWRSYCWKTLWTGCQANLRLQAIPCNVSLMNFQHVSKKLQRSSSSSSAESVVWSCEGQRWQTTSPQIPQDDVLSYILRVVLVSLLWWRWNMVDIVYFIHFIAVLFANCWWSRDEGSLVNDWPLAGGAIDILITAEAITETLLITVQQQKKKKAG